jgi:hypothetical protein
VRNFYDSAQEVFNLASDYTARAGLTSEIEWQRNSDFHSFSETQLLAETAWVILCSGFRESIVRRIFDHISLCFFDWESALLIVQHRSICINAARDSLRYEAKLNAIVSCAEMIVKEGFDQIKRTAINDPIATLKRFPFIGPVTAWHLAKNLGLDVAKPDRHLVRLAQLCGYSSATALCEDLARKNNEAVKVVDLILWRYLADNPGVIYDAWETSNLIGSEISRDRSPTPLVV